jgi:hypothetical protein
VRILGFFLLGISVCWIMDFLLAVLCFSLGVLPSSIWFPDARAVAYGIAFGVAAFVIQMPSFAARPKSQKMIALAVVVFAGFLSVAYVRIQQRMDGIPIFEIKKP